MEINFENCKKKFFKNRIKYYEEKSLIKLINILQKLHKKKNCEEVEIVKEAILKKLKESFFVTSSSAFGSFAQLNSYDHEGEFYKHLGNGNYLRYVPKVYYDRIELIFKDVSVTNIDISQIFYLVRENIIKHPEIYMDQKDNCIILTIKIGD